MAKFNQSTKDTQFTTNKEGEKAYKLSDKTRLVMRVMTSLVNEPKFYGDTTNDLIADATALALKDPEFVIKTAVYARNQMYLRSVPILLMALVADKISGDKIFRKALPEVLKRADEPGELLSAYISLHNGGKEQREIPIPNRIKRGISDVMNTFDEYQFAKYNRDGSVKLKDVLNICHPRPKDKLQSILFKKILDNKLAIPETWETYISIHGSTRENWQYIAPKMPYMAKLRNLRNFLEKGIDNLDEVVAHISSKEADLTSKQFPFRFFSAYKEIESMESPCSGVPKVLDALQDAIDISIANLPKLGGRTMIMTDNSGSMTSPISKKSKMKMIEIGNLFGAMAASFSDDADVYVFGQGYHLANLSHRTGILDNCNKLCAIDVGHSTNAHLPVEYAILKNIYYDRIILFSDMQVWNDNIWNYGSGAFINSINDYHKKINKDVFIHSVDLAGYGTAQFNEHDKKVNLVAGFSDKLLNYFGAFERGADSMIAEIEAINIDTGPIPVDVHYYEI